MPTSTQVAAGATEAQFVEFGVVSASLTCTLFSVVLPVLVAVTVNVSTSPSVTLPLPSLSALLESTLVTVIALVAKTGVRSDALKYVQTSGQNSLAVARPVLLIAPFVTSVAVTV